jgi:ABC-type glycerol-3-phosphate transport system substrate-binding protein
MLSYVVAIPVAASLLLAGCNNGGKTADAGAGGSKKIVIAWAKWEPADNLQKLAADYTKETGTEVEVQQIPWSDFETKINSAWSGQDSSFDLVVGDSQWLGKGATAQRCSRTSRRSKPGFQLMEHTTSVLAHE